MLEQMKTTSDLHLQRKAFHMATVFSIFLCMVYFDQKINWTIYVVAGVPALMLDVFRHSSTRLNQFTLKVLKPVLRVSEINKISGAGWTVISVGLAYALFPTPIAQLSVLFLAVGDPIASAFGLKFGSKKIFGAKSFEGFLAGQIACTIAAYFFLKHVVKLDEMLILMSFLCGLIGAFSELFTIGKLDDNFTQPLMSAAMLTVTFYLYGGLL